MSTTLSKIINFSPILISTEYMDSPFIFDPITKKNVSKNSFRIKEVKDSMGWAFDYLQTQKIQHDKNCNAYKHLNLINELLFKTTSVYNID